MNMREAFETFRAKQCKENGSNKYYIDAVLRKDENGNYVSLSTEWGFKDFQAGYQAGLAAQAQQSQWISVQERLPENTNQVICRAIGLLVPIETIKISSLNSEKTGFYVEYDGSGSAPIEEITHWMPLPLAPVSVSKQPEGDRE